MGFVQVVNIACGEEYKQLRVMKCPPRYTPLEDENNNLIPT